MVAGIRAWATAATSGNPVNAAVASNAFGRETLCKKRFAAYDKVTKAVEDDKRKD